jgi:general secretion pathway protein C
MGLFRKKLNFRDIVDVVKAKASAWRALVTEHVARLRERIAVARDRWQSGERPKIRITRESLKNALENIRKNPLFSKGETLSVDDLVKFRQKWKFILIAGWAVVAAHIMTAFLGRILVSNRPPKLPAFQARLESPLQKKQIGNYKSVYENTFFDHEGFIPDYGLGRPGSLDLSTAQPTTLPLELIGTIVLSRDDLSVASIKDNQANTIEAYQKNNPIGAHQATVWKVEYRKVYILRHTGVLEYVEMPEDKNALFVIKKTAKGPVEGIRMDDENSYSIGRKFLDDQLANLNDLVRQARAIPYFENGQVIGFQIVNIQKGSVFEQVGIAENDVICEVNDIPLNNQGQALSLFNQLKDMAEGSLSIVICAGGKNRVLTYNIK